MLYTLSIISIVPVRPDYTCAKDPLHSQIRTRELNLSLPVPRASGKYFMASSVQLQVFPLCLRFFDGLITSLWAM